MCDISKRKHLILWNMHIDERIGGIQWMLNYGSTGDGLCENLQVTVCKLQSIHQKAEGPMYLANLLLLLLILCDTEEGLYKILDEKAPFKMCLLCSDSFSGSSAYLKVFLTLSTLLAFKKTFAPSPVLKQSYQTCIQKCLLVVTISISMKASKAKQPIFFFFLICPVPVLGGHSRCPSFRAMYDCRQKAISSIENSLITVPFLHRVFFFFFPSPWH